MSCSPWSPARQFSMASTILWVSGSKFWQKITISSEFLGEAHTWINYKDIRVLLSSFSNFSWLFIPVLYKSHFQKTKCTLFQMLGLYRLGVFQSFFSKLLDLYPFKNVIFEVYTKGEYLTQSIFSYHSSIQTMKATGHG